MYGAPKPVAIVPRGYGAGDDHGLQRLGVAFDGSAEAYEALETGIGLAEALGDGATLTVLCVSDPPRYAYGSGWPVSAMDELERASREHTQQLLDRALIRIPGGIEHEGRILDGLAARALATASGDFDLMLVGSRAHGPIRRTVLGSTTRALIRMAGCPVLVLPRGVGIDPLGLDGRRRESFTSPIPATTAEPA
jgi:nucleotide-binding universal stress UspA family protein